MCVLGHVQLFMTPWTIAHLGPLFMGFPNQEHWGGLPFPSPGNLPDPGIDKPILLWAIANTECPNNIAYVSSPRELIGVQLSYYVFWESGVPSFIFPSSVWRALNSVNTGFLFNWNKNLYHTKGSFYLQKQMNNWYFVIMFQMIYFNILL